MLGGLYGLLCIEMDVKWRVLRCFGVIMFFRKDPPQTEGRRYADLDVRQCQCPTVSDCQTVGLSDTVV